MVYSVPYSLCMSKELALSADMHLSMRIETRSSGCHLSVTELQPVEWCNSGLNF